MTVVIPREAFEHRKAILQSQIFTLQAKLEEIEFWLRECEEPEDEETP